MPKKTNKSQLKQYARFSGIAIQMGITIYLGSLLGEWLDNKYPNSNNLYTKICTLAAVFIAMYSVIKQVINFSKDND
ncbi:AtpZ/AtpI family protein [uncultured Tenacibaculum sp.]|uniref:AtpZ/AtpI family protein n=1 Tax=uncultured Tenacibaculum sp. TaxID=174713 RepID=UPI0026185F9E|nr:AtpZ/AtpI family protein [uncultured Tenacibaculum sp.]